jgi:hypothetical protein
LRPPLSFYAIAMDPNVYWQSPLDQDRLSLATGSNDSEASQPGPGRPPGVLLVAGGRLLDRLFSHVAVRAGRGPTEAVCRVLKRAANLRRLPGVSFECKHEADVREYLRRTPRGTNLRDVLVYIFASPIISCSHCSDPALRALTNSEDVRAVCRQLVSMIRYVNQPMRSVPTAYLR